MDCRLRSRRRIFPLILVLTAAACSKGTLYLGDDGSDYKYQKVTDYAGESPSIGLKDVYGSKYELFFGSGVDYYELLYIFPGIDQKSEKIERFIFRQTKPLNMVEIALQAEQAFNPMRDAECFVKITANLAKKDFCEGSSTCMQFQNLEVFSETHETCDWRRLPDFIVKVDAGGNFGYVNEPDQDAWTRIERINIDEVSSIPLQISPDDALFTSVVAASTSDGYVVAGKISTTHKISASYFKLADENAEPSEPGSENISTVVLADSLGKPYMERAATRNVLLVTTPDGFYRLNDLRLWEKLPLPAGLTAMPAGNVVRLESANGVALAAFRFIVKESGVNRNIVILFKEADAALAVIDMSTLGIEGSQEDWTMDLINGELWFWNPVAPALARRYVPSENKWTQLTLKIPVPEVPESLVSYQLSSAGSGFILTTNYFKDVLPNIDRSTSQTVKRKVFRHHYYNELGEASGSYVETYAPPEALRFHKTKMYAERVVGMGPFGEDTVLDYGYIYDFQLKKGRMFQDAAFSSTRTERVAHLGGIIVSDKSLFFYGGCDHPVKRLCLSTSPVSRLVKFKNDIDSM